MKSNSLVVALVCLMVGLILGVSLVQAVYQCGDQTDDCYCGMSNPYPCCDNNCDGDCTDVCDGNCCWWAWDQACCHWGVGLPGWGDAKNWASKAQQSVYPVSSTPAVNTIACRVSGLGHVAWVTGVSGDKSTVTVTEMNCWNPNGGPCDQCSGEASTYCTDIGHSYRICTRSSSWFDGEYIYPRDNVQATANVNVRTGPGLSYPEISDPDYPGYAPMGSIGEILDGPVDADGYIWWEVDWGLYAGWSAENWLKGVVGEPTITSSLEIIQDPPYYVGDTITATFTITNKMNAPFIFDVLTVGGRDPDNEVADFDWDEDIPLNPGNSYTYEGYLTLSKVGNYHFFCAYREPDGSWNTAIPTESGVTNTLDITVGEAIPEFSTLLIPVIGMIFLFWVFSRKYKK